MKKLLILFSLLAIFNFSSMRSELLMSNPASFTNDYQVALATPALTPTTITSSTVTNKRLRGFEIWSSVGVKALVYTLSNGVQSSSPVVVGGAAPGMTFEWIAPYPDFVMTGNTGGQDAFQIVATNLNSNNAADIHVVFHYSSN